MTFSNIRMITDRNGEDRVLFDSYTEENDINPENGKVGIRCHHWFVAFFIWLFWDGIVDFKDVDGTIYPLNRNSFDQWRARQAAALNIQTPSILPSAEEIIARHKDVLEENHAALVIQSTTRAYWVRKHLPEFKEVKKEIDELKAQIAKCEKDKTELEQNLIDVTVAFDEDAGAKLKKTKEMETQHAAQLVELEAKKKVLAEIEANIVKLQSELTETEAAFTNAQTAVTKPYKEALKAKKKASAAREDALAEQKETEDAKTQTETAKKEAEAAKEKPEGGIKGFFKELVQDSPEALAEKITKLDQKIEALKTTIKIEEQKIVEEDEKIATILKPVKDLKKQIDNQKASIESLQNTLSKEKQEAGEFEQEILKISTSPIVFLKEQLSNIDMSKKKTQEECETQIGALKKNIEEATTTLEQKKEVYDELLNLMHGIVSKPAEAPIKEAKDAKEDVESSSEKETASASSKEAPKTEGKESASASEQASSTDSGEIQIPLDAVDATDSDKKPGTPKIKSDSDEEREIPTSENPLVDKAVDVK